MRKLSNCLVIIVIMLVCSLNCVNKIFASEVPEFRIAYELLDYWYGIYGEEMYPDYICGVWTETGSAENMVFGITKDEKGEEGKEEILNMIEDDSSVSFVYQSYSYRELKKVQEEITEYLDFDKGIYGCGIYDNQNQIGIDININNPDALETAKEIGRKYPGMITLEDSDGMITEDTEELFDAGKGQNNYVFLIIIPCLFIILICLFIIMIRNKNRVPADGYYSMAEIERVCHRSEIIPAASLDDKIMKLIQNESK